METRPESGLAPGPRLVMQLHPRDEGLAVEIIESPVGESAAADIRLQRIDDVLRMVSQPTFHEDVGAGLFRALFPDELRDLYRESFTQAAVEGERLTIELCFDRALVRAARYPWELLHDGTRFLLRSGSVSLTRSLDFPNVPRPAALPLEHRPESADPLEILLVSAQPPDQPALEPIFQPMQTAFHDHLRDQALDLAYLLPPTWESLMDWLLAGAPDVLHFEGHGVFTRTGLLLFEGADGGDPVDAAAVGSAFFSTRLQLAVLTACRAASGGETLLSSVAPSLILAGIPAVVAMQQPLPGEFAVRFLRALYESLRAGHGLEAAVEAGRRQLARTTVWHVPTLFTRASRTAPGADPVARRVDTAGPRSAPVGYPLRVGLWIRCPDSPAPETDELRRLLGASAGDTTGAPAPAPDEPPESPGWMRPGVIDVRLTAPGCEIHDGPRRAGVVLAESDSPPVWFAITPHRAGPVTLTFELRQDGALIAAAAQVLDVARAIEGPPVAVVRSHLGRPPERAHVIVVDDSPVPDGASDPLPEPVSAAPVEEYAPPAVPDPGPDERYDPVQVPRRRPPDVQGEAVPDPGAVGFPNVSPEFRPGFEFREGSGSPLRQNGAKSPPGSAGLRWRMLVILLLVLVAVAAGAAVLLLGVV